MISGGLRKAGYLAYLIAMATLPVCDVFAMSPCTSLLQAPTGASNYIEYRAPDGTKRRYSLHDSGITQRSADGIIALEIGFGTFVDGKFQEHFREPSRWAPTLEVVSQPPGHTPFKRTREIIPPEVVRERTSPAPITSEVFTTSDLRPIRDFPVKLNHEIGTRHFPNPGLDLLSDIHRLVLEKHAVEIWIPRHPGFDRMTDGIIQAVSELPRQRIEVLDTVLVNPVASSYDTFHRKTLRNFREAAMTATENRTMNIFPAAFRDFQNAHPNSQAYVRHEFGHLIAHAVFGEFTPSRLYIAGAKTDAFPVSEYGQNNWSEDFAEAIEAYLRSLGGNLIPEMRGALEHRFEFIDREIFPNRLPQSITAPRLARLPLPRWKIEVYAARIASQAILVLVPELGFGAIVGTRPRK